MASIKTKKGTCMSSNAQNASSKKASTEQESAFSVIDKPTFFGSLILLLSVTIPLIIWPDQGAQWVAAAKDFVTSKLGVLYLLLGVGAGGFMVYIMFSDIGQIKLGEPEEKPEFLAIL
jgi:BCCT family betaine/carnitine transporter